MKDPFASREVVESKTLRAIAAALLLYSCVTFKEWHPHLFLSSVGAAAGDQVPTWIFDALGAPARLGLFWHELYFTFLFLLGIGGALLLCGPSALPSLVILAFLLVNKAFFFFSDLRLHADSHLLHLGLTLLFLFGREKLMLMRSALLATHWALALSRLGGSTPAASTTAFFLLPLGWLIPAPWVGRACAAALAALHFSSIETLGTGTAYLLVPLLFAAFHDLGRGLLEGVRLSRAQAPGFALLGALLAANLSHFLTPGDVLLTGEGRLTAFARPQRIYERSARVEIEKGSSKLVMTLDWPERELRPTADPTVFYRGVAYSAEMYENGRLAAKLPDDVLVREGELLLWNPRQLMSLRPQELDPYPLYSLGKRLCRDYRPDRLKIEYFVWLDAGKEKFSMVELPDFCRTAPAYRPLGRNAWIRLPEESRLTVN